MESLKRGFHDPNSTPLHSAGCDCRLLGDGLLTLFGVPDSRAHDVYRLWVREVDHARANPTELCDLWTSEVSSLSVEYPIGALPLWLR